MARVFAAAWLAVAVAGCSSPEPPKMTYPATAKVDQVDTYHGVSVPDPYRWLEDDRSAATAAWVEAQNAVTFAHLDTIPFRATLTARLEQLFDYPKFSEPFRRGTTYFLLWHRVGEDGDATSLIANADTFVAPAAGEIFVTVRPPGLYWSDRRGSYPAGSTDAPAVPVDIEIDLIRFNGAAASGLAALAAAGDAAATAAIDSGAARKRLPAEFASLWFLGQGNVWSDGASDGRPGITAESDDDTDIVKKALDIPLTPNTQITFDWRYDAVPALGPETEEQFHDYVSVALEFDNGQDLTWFRSGHLEAGTHFHCPLAWWDSRETHYVLQGAEAPLGQWSTHTRNVLADYAAAVGGDAPTRIVGVWFISNSLFGRQRAAASFADVAVIDGEQRVNVF